jgi:plastocyanin
MRLRIAVALACTWGLLAGDATAAGKPATHTVVMEGVKFIPEMLTVRRGDTVVWVNKDPFPHTATAKGAFDSRSIAAGGSWKYTPRKAGDYAYVCTFHPNMKATLRVTRGD